MAGRRRIDKTVDTLAANRLPLGAAQVLKSASKVCPGSPSTASQEVPQHQRKSSRRSNSSIADATNKEGSDLKKPATELQTVTTSIADTSQNENIDLKKPATEPQTDTTNIADTSQKENLDLNKATTEPQANITGTADTKEDTAYPKSAENTITSADMEQEGMARIAQNAALKLERQNKRIIEADPTVAPASSFTRGGRGAKTSKHDFINAPDISFNHTRMGSRSSPSRASRGSSRSRSSVRTGQHYASDMERQDSAIGGGAKRSSEDAFQVITSKRNKVPGTNTLVSAGLNAYEAQPEQKQATVEATYNKHDIMAVFGNELPPSTFIDQNPGMRNGQLQFIQHPNGDVSAHQWSADRFMWENIGQYSNIRKKIEGQLGSERLKGETAQQTLMQNTLAYFRTVAKQREATVMGLPFGINEISAAMPTRTSTPVTAVPLKPASTATAIMQQELKPAIPRGLSLASETGAAKPSTVISDSSTYASSDDRPPFPQPIYADFGHDNPTNIAPLAGAILTRLPPNLAQQYRAFEPQIPTGPRMSRADFELQFPDYFRPQQIFGRPSIPGASYEEGQREQLHPAPVGMLQRNSFPAQPRTQQTTGFQSYEEAFPDLSHTQRNESAPPAFEHKRLPSHSRAAMREYLTKLGDSATARNQSGGAARTVLHDPFKDQPPSLAAPASATAPNEAESAARPGITFGQLRYMENSMPYVSTAQSYPQHPSYPTYTTNPIGTPSKSGLPYVSTAQSYAQHPFYPPYTTNPNGTPSKSGLPADLMDSSPDRDWQRKPPDTYQIRTPSGRLAPVQKPQTLCGPFFTSMVLADTKPKRHADEELREWFKGGNTFARQEEFFQQIKTSNQSTTTSTPIGSTTFNTTGTPSRTFPSPISPPAARKPAPSAQAESKKPDFNETTTRILIPVLENLTSYVQGPPESRRDYFSRWSAPPEWCVDKSPNGSCSFFDKEWGMPPERLGRDARYRGLGEGLSGGYGGSYGMGGMEVGALDGRFRFGRL